MKDSLKLTIAAVGWPVALSSFLGISSAAVSQWEACPALRVLAVEAAFGVPRYELRPDLYPPPSTSPAPPQPEAVVP